MVMPKRQPTPRQRYLLELLNEMEYSTTAQLWEQVPNPPALRAQRAVLARLASYGWVHAAALYPERGAASPRYWTLTPAGAEALGVPYVPPTAKTLTAVRAIVTDDPPTAPVGVTANQAAVLTLLAQWHQLTTSQIWRYVHADCTVRATRKLLHTLEGRGLIRGQDLPGRSGRPTEHYWTLLERGAHAIHSPYDKHCRRRPTLVTLAYRGLQLDLMNQVAVLGWMLISPNRYRPTVPRPDETPQYQHLKQVVLAHEGAQLARLLAQGYGSDALQDRLTRYTGGHIGATVPSDINDYVAYDPDQPRQTVVLIPHPPAATPTFWTRRPLPAAGTTGQRGRQDARLERYAALAKVLPVVGVFATTAALHSYQTLLGQAGLHATTINNLSDTLLHLKAR
jgi:hypothetical protein